MRRLFLVPLASGVAIVAIGCGGSAHRVRPSAVTVPAPPGRTLTTRTFTTVVPKSWHARTLRRGRTVVYFVGTPGARVDDLGLPHPSGAGLTLLSAPGRARALSGNPLALVRHAVGLPAGAARIRLLAPAHRTTLGGTPAGALTFAYRHHGRDVRQQDVVARHGGTLALVELDTIVAPGPAAARTIATARAAFAAVVGRWRWRG